MLGQIEIPPATVGPAPFSPAAAAYPLDPDTAAMLADEVRGSYQAMFPASSMSVAVPPEEKSAVVPVVIGVGLVGALAALYFLT